MFILKKVLFFILVLVVIFSCYHGHFNSLSFEIVIFILLFLKIRYPNSKILHILFTKLSPISEEGMLYSQYISQLILFNAKYILILLVIATIMYSLNPDILISISISSVNILAIVMTMILIFIFLIIILFVVNIFKYMYIKIFHKDSIYKP